MAVYTIRSGASSHPEASVLQFPTDLLAASGVINLSGIALKVVAQTVPDMTVKVSIGRAYLKSASSSAYPVLLDATTNVTITANSSGNSRIDAIVCYADLSATPSTDASNVIKFVAVAGTPAGSPTAPSDGTIQTAIGAANPFLRLANVTVASGATSITSGNIADARVSVKIKVEASYGDITTDTDGATVTFDMSVSNKHTVVLGGNRILAVSNVAVGQAFIIRLVQDSSTRTVTWFSTIKWPGGVAPTLTAGGNKTDVFGFICTSAGNYDGFIVGQNM